MSRRREPELPGAPGAFGLRVVREVVGEYLTDEEIAATLVRRDLILAWLAKRIRDLGENAVLY